MTEGHAPTAGEYFQHHLQNLSVSIGDSAFWTLNLDTIFLSILLGIVGFGFLYFIARGIRPGVPTRRQAAVEFLVDWVDREVKAVIGHHDRSILGPLALTIFFWVVLMNAMDFLPVDLLPEILKHAGIGHFKAVPTADLNATLGISLSVGLAIIFFSFKIKGVGGYTHELLGAPFGSNILLWVPNFLMNVIELLSKSFSLAMRLFCNMYAGELVFLLIALLGGAASISVGGLALGFGHVVLGAAWAIFHILIIVLQAYIFMMLTIIYVGLAHETH